MIPYGLQILENLLRYPPVEGSIASHEAWKYNVRTMLILVGGWEKSEFINVLNETGYISQQCRYQAKFHLEKVLLPYKAL